jgi:protein tyrosine phosphatase
MAVCMCDSAGVGRTGTFISLDYLYEQATDSGRVDVLGCVRKLRQQRMDMVQKEVSGNILSRVYDNNGNNNTTL